MKAQRWQILRTGLGLLYPVYRSIQAILTEDLEDDLTWLRYWVVLAMVTLVEMVLDPMVDLFPYYLLAKCSFLIWCLAPSPNNGVSFIFTQVKSWDDSILYLFDKKDTIISNPNCFPSDEKTIPIRDFSYKEKIRIFCIILKNNTEGDLSAV